MSRLPRRLRGVAQDPETLAREQWHAIQAKLPSECQRPMPEYAMSDEAMARNMLVEMSTPGFVEV
jgi:hypothetical protein